jgi:hypothetical protein
MSDIDYEIKTATLKKIYAETQKIQKEQQEIDERIYFSSSNFFGRNQLALKVLGGMIAFAFLLFAYVQNVFLPMMQLSNMEKELSLYEKLKSKSDELQDAKEKLDKRETDINNKSKDLEDKEKYLVFLKQQNAQKVKELVHRIVDLENQKKMPEGYTINSKKSCCECTVFGYAVDDKKDGVSRTTAWDLDPTLPILTFKWSSERCVNACLFEYNKIGGKLFVRRKIDVGDASLTINYATESQCHEVFLELTSREINELPPEQNQKNKDIKNNPFSEFSIFEGKL